MNTPATRLCAIVLAIVAFTPLTASAQASGDSVRYSHRELKQRIAEAHTAPEYQALALYFRSRERIFTEKAAAEKAEWDRRKTMITGPAAKFPTPADSARNLYQYYVYEAGRMAKQAANYESREQQQPATVNAASHAQ